jgi:hypothetical protein
VNFFHLLFSFIKNGWQQIKMRENKPTGSKVVHFTCNPFLRVQLCAEQQTKEMSGKKKNDLMFSLYPLSEVRVGNNTRGEVLFRQS